ncbi:hypothetical protein GGI07_000321 [Coemansia sp. Benny D115]|nr:hypothetical protein GGI07_000321 [Coemansia sp. Benny D115]
MGKNTGGTLAHALDLGLHGAVARGDIGSICYALLGGQPIDSVAQGLQPIHVAATQDDAAVVEVLLQNGADVNAQTTAPTRHKEPPQPQAQAQAQSPQSPRSPWRGVRGRGSFLFVRDSGIGPISAPLGFATGLHAMQAASDSRANDTQAVQSTEYHGATPLHFAVANGRAACAAALVRGGARLDIADSFGNTPESLAAACGHRAIADLLLGTAPQLPSPDPSDVSFAEALLGEWGSNDTHEDAAAPARRHTDGDASCRPRNALSPTPTPAAAAAAAGCGGRMAARLRGTSPIGIRALWRSSDSGRSASAAARLASDTPAATSAATSRRRPKRGAAEPTPRAPATRLYELTPRARAGMANDAPRSPRPLSRNSSSGSRRERSYTDSVIERAWRSYLEDWDADAADSAAECAMPGGVPGDGLRPLAEPWMWRQAAMAIRNRRSQSLSTNSHHT